ncbi:inactive TPR repeat-containing thioredoxin TTL3-like isoform X6 [Canna indica]|uniref:Inactive TPR repeat-containing thioredoxin TTL3-like isoform X6 n=1 Tax=Canna indica TaxID=4628 RepID=A0AAQ3K7I9_9LILI|nr:inactive TPR repeat-containing thioredoxin TTL3-like isoform X6 [Canna indica]
MDDENGRKASGCGLFVLYNSIFRRGTTLSSSPRHPSSTAQSPRTASLDSKRRRPGSDEDSLLMPTNAPHASVNSAPSTAKAASYAPTGGYRKASGRPAAGAYPGSAARPRNMGLSGELDSMINDHQRSKGGSTLVRASSGNVMVFGNLGNIRAPGAVTPNRNVLDYLPQTAKEKGGNADNKQRPKHNPGAATGHAPRSNAADAEVEDEDEVQAAPPEVLCRALSKRLEPEELKEMGNEEYKNGRYAEAVALYDRAILIDPEKASYWSNKAAALMAMGQLLEAVGDCKEAVRIDPSYGRAHRRLATIYLRLGETEKAIHHFKLARNEASSEDIVQAHRLQNHISKCNEARKLRDWHTVLKEAQSAVSSCADAAPQILAANVEALLSLGRQEEAETTSDSSPVFDIDESIKFFGASRSAYFLSVRALVHMAAGRFEDAVSLAQKASQIDPSSREVNAVARKTRAVASSRLAGNDFFKVSKFKEACSAYGEGLDHDPQNATLLCNRAACRSKLGQWEKAIDDCNAALNMRPSYSKARMRRADCNAKLERWEAAFQDYEALVQQLPGDEEVSKGLMEAQQKLKKQRGEDTRDDKSGANLVNITRKDQLKQYISSPGVSVALIFNHVSELPRQTMPFVEKISKEYPKVNFLKLDVGQNPSLKEYGDSDPVFLVYKNGGMAKEIDALDLEELRSSLMEFSS